ncbi:unnamed protein product [Aphanomyces euteiches]
MAFVGFRAEYTFDMVPKTTGPIDALCSQVYAIRESVDEIKARTDEIKRSQEGSTAQALHLSTVQATKSYNDFEWAKKKLPPPRFATLNGDSTEIKIKQSGLYNIQVAGQCNSSSGIVVLKINNLIVAQMGAVQQDNEQSGKYQVHLSHTALLVSGSKLKVSAPAVNPCDHPKCAAGRCKKVKISEKATLSLHSLGISQDDDDDTESESD